MGAWKRICCPVDFSGVSAVAMEEAARAAARRAGMPLPSVEPPTPARSSETGQAETHFDVFRR